MLAQIFVTAVLLFYAYMAIGFYWMDEWMLESDPSFALMYRPDACERYLQKIMWTGYFCFLAWVVISLGVFYHWFVKV